MNPSPSDSENLRLFVGIPVSGEVLQQFRAGNSEIGVVQGMKYVPEENWHLTLFFFGKVPAEMLDNLISLIYLAVKGQRPFTLTFDRWVWAPKKSAPRMLWGRFRKHPDFRALSNRLLHAYLQIAPDHQHRYDPLPHVTLARIRREEGQKLPALPRLPEDALTLHVEKLILWKSILSPDGSTYTPVETFQLA